MLHLRQPPYTHSRPYWCETNLSLSLSILIKSYVLNGTPERPVGLTGPGVHRPGRCAIQIFYHIGQGPVHSKYILTYRPAGTLHKYSIISVRDSGSGAPNIHLDISTGQYTTQSNYNIRNVEAQKMFNKWRQNIKDAEYNT